MGGKSKYVPATGDAIIEWIANGKTLRDFCRQPKSPSWSAVYQWLEQTPEFAERFARARDMGHDAIAEETLEIADNTLPGQRIEESEDGKKVVTEDMLGHRKLKIDTRLKLLAKWNPKKYGDKVDLTHANPDGSPLALTVTFVDKG